jgi:hypothetical protein
MAMNPLHRLAHQLQRPDGGVEWACPRCGHYLVRYPHSQVVVLPGAPNSVHVPGPGFPPDPADIPVLSEFDQRFLRSHAMAWSQGHEAA